MPAELILAPGGYRYAVARRVPAEDAAGRPVLLALCFIEFPNGHRMKHAIREDFIQYAGEDVIDIEVQDAVSRL
jgi:hypothetical protein